MDKGRIIDISKCTLKLRLDLFVERFCDRHGVDAKYRSQFHDQAQATIHEIVPTMNRLSAFIKVHQGLLKLIEGSEVDGISNYRG